MGNSGYRISLKFSIIWLQSKVTCTVLSSLKSVLPVRPILPENPTSHPHDENPLFFVSYLSAKTDNIYYSCAVRLCTFGEATFVVCACGLFILVGVSFGSVF